MHTRQVSIKIFGVIFGFALLCGLGFGGNASAQDRRNRNWDGYPNWGGSYELRQTALNAGFNEGSKEGRNDRAKGKRSAYSDFSDYQKATSDYSSKLGNRELYRRYYRRAFESGYDTENPGQFRTDWAGRSMDRTPRSIVDYDAVMNPIRAARQAKNGNQPGDPSKAAETLLRLVEADNPPTRLFLGEDALGLVVQKLEQMKGEIAAWEALSRSTDFAP